jgi:hypothetical protein
MPAKFSLFTVAALPIVPIALACSGDDAGMITVRPDAAPMIDAAPVVCTASTTYGNVLGGSNDQFAGSSGADSMLQVFWGGRMNTQSKPDFLQVSLRTGLGPFSGGIVPATVQLTGEETMIETCSACVLMFTDLFSSGGQIQVTDYYMPTAGTVMLTSTAGDFQGTITGLMLQHVVMAGNTFAPANDGCVVSIPTVTMNAEIEPQMMTATGKPLDGNVSFRFKLPNRTF